MADTRSQKIMRTKKIKKAVSDAIAGNIGTLSFVDPKEKTLEVKPIPSPSSRVLKSKLNK